MKAVFLAAGRGSRLGKITEEKPKSLLTICNGTQTLLSYNLNNLFEIGITDYIIITGFMHQELEDYVFSWAKDKDVNIQYVHNPFWSYCNVLGSFYCALNEIKDDFLYLHADTVVDKKVWINLLKKNSDFVITVDLKKCGDEEMKVLIDNSLLVDISKKISTKEASGEFVGIAKFTKNTLHFFKETAIKIFDEKGLNFYMEETLRIGIKSNKIIVDWIDVSKYHTVEVDFLDDLNMANVLFNN
jgi:choline kinase